MGHTTQIDEVLSKQKYKVMRWEVGGVLISGETRIDLWQVVAFEQRLEGNQEFQEQPRKVGAIIIPIYR